MVTRADFWLFLYIQLLPLFFRGHRDPEKSPKLVWMKLTFYHSMPKEPFNVSSWAERSGVELLRRRSKSARCLHRSGIFFAWRSPIALKIFTWFSLCSKKRVSQKAFLREEGGTRSVTKGARVYKMVFCRFVSVVFCYWLFTATKYAHLIVFMHAGSFHHYVVPLPLGGRLL